MSTIDLSTLDAKTLGSGVLALLNTMSSTTTSTTTTTTTLSNKIPIDPRFWAEEDNQGDARSSENPMGQLSDGILDTSIIMGYSKIISQDVVYYDLYETLSNVTIQSCVLQSYEGSGSPWVLSVIYQGVETILASFTGGQYETPITYTPPTPLKADRLVVRSNNSIIPTEMSLYGTYTPKSITSSKQKPVKFGDAMGLNVFEWDVELPANPEQIQTTQDKIISTGFTQVRHYLDWQHLEPGVGQKGLYTFSPSHAGSWDYDLLYSNWAKEGILVLPCIKTQPSWMQATWPATLVNDENVPVIYGLDFTKYTSYIDQAKMLYQFAGRYGSNTKVTGLTVDSSLRWTGDTPNVVKSGLGLIKYMEVENERDKWWKGSNAYQTFDMAAANLSAVYDGHMNTMGPGVGIKNADPNMIVVMGGLAAGQSDYIRGMMDWCRANRGLKPDGTVNFCWDIVNYHDYNESLVAGVVAGTCPELSDSVIKATSMLYMSLEYGFDTWVTETGYDEVVGSPVAAFAIGTKTVDLVKADWILRTALLYIRCGINKTFFYQDYDLVKGNAGTYATSGLLDTTLPNGRKPSADYLYQVNNLMGSYTFKSTKIDNSTGVYIDTYINGSSTILVIFSPTQTGISVAYNTGILTGTLYTPTPASLTMKSSVSNGMIQVTETPVFLKY